MSSLTHEQSAPRHSLAGHRWISGLAILLVVLTVLTAWWVWHGRTEPLKDYGAAPSFTLTDQRGRPVSSDSLAGHVVLANFVYTTCTDICPALSGQMLGVQERLRGEQLLGTDVQLLSFTVDPARDTPDVLRAYAERYRADPDVWRFLTGPEGVLKPLIVEGFHLGVQVLPPATAVADSEHSHGAYEVMHSGRFVLIDQDGHVRAYYNGSEFEPERVVRDIQQLLD